MKERFESNSKNMIRSFEQMSMNNTFVDKLNEVVDKLTYFPIQLAQNHVDTIVWAAAYDTAIRNLKLDQKKAVDYADSFVVRTQTTNNVSGVPVIRSGTVFDRMWTTFSSVPVGMAGIQLEMKGRAKTAAGATKTEILLASPKFAAIMLNAITFTALLPGLLSAVVGLPAQGFKAITTNDEDEKDEYLESLALRAIPESIDSIFPIFAQNIAGLYGGYTGDQRFAQVGVLPLASQVLSGAKGTRALYERATGEIDEFSDANLRDMTIAFSLGTGIPLSAIPFTLKRVEKTVPELNFDDIFSDIDLPR